MSPRLEADPIRGMLKIPAAHAVGTAVAPDQVRTDLLYRDLSG
jgi:hypothetical protein